MKGEIVWTVQAVYEHFMRLREADQAALQRALAASDTRLMGMNEFRASQSDILAKAMMRTEGDARFAALAEKIDGVVTRQNITEGAQIGALRFWGTLVSVIASVGTAVAIYIALK
jgi:hypothetical protein